IRSVWRLQRSLRSGYYIPKGFNKTMAEYYASGRKKVLSVKPKEDFTLFLTFNNGENRVFDVKPILKKGGVFAPFRDYNNFKRVYIDDVGCVSWDIDPKIDSTVVWNNKVDISSDTCYVDSVPV
ncbi:MAG: DUF2442 domain-containing protein, partial [Acutalibacteraceae bacterium]